MTESWSRLREGLADRYRVGDELGHGGMAVVFHATDLRHDRPVAIKVLRPELAALLGRERFLREIRTVAQLTHPHILPLLDSGEVADQPFYVMPFVDGGTLRQRLDRSGPLPVAEAVTLARAAADALAYAHGRGFVHRDIKPENILFEAGHPVLADFGIVRALDRAGGETLTEAGMVLGTPAYMSPEQSLGTEEVDHRSDQYSLACVLYESLAGEPPFTGPTTRAILAKRLGTDPPKVSVVRRAVPAALDGVIGRALAVTPADRFESAGAFEAALAGASPAPASSGRPPRRGRRIAVMLLVLAALVATTVRFVSSTGLDFSAREWAVIAALDNQTGDSVFEGSLDGALAVGLQQSRYVNVVPRPQIAATLALMQRTDSTRLSEAVAREVALRANAKVLVVPAISRIDSTYLLTMRIVDPGTGSDLRTRSDRAEGRGRVLTTLDRLVRGLRRDLGESRSELAANGVRLDQATTPSLDALLAWTEGNAAWNSRRFDDAEERYRAALGYDPQFAMANAMLGAYFSYIGRPDSSQVHFEAALAELDHLTEREQLRIRASYEQSVGNLPAAIRAQEVFVERYPDDLAEVYNLGSIYMRGRRPADAIRVLRDVVARDSTYVAAFINLATSHAINGTYAEAMPYYRRAFALRPDYRVSGNLNHEYGLAFLRLGQLDSAEATYRAMLDGTVFQQASGRRSLASLRMYQGRYAEAAGELETAVRLTRVSREPVSEFRNLLYLATVRTTAGRAPEALTAVRAAHGIADTLPLASPWLARLATRYHRLGDTGAVRRLLGLLRSRASANSPDDQMAVIGTEARLALATGDPAGAAERVREIQSLPGASATEYEPLLATALDRMNQPAAADSAYRTVLGSLAPLGWEPQDDWLRAHLEFAELAERRGDTATSLEYYDRLLTLWREGDGDLPPLVEARRRAATLRR